MLVIQSKAIEKLTVYHLFYNFYTYNHSPQLFLAHLFPSTAFSFSYAYFLNQVNGIPVVIIWTYICNTFPIDTNLLHFLQITF